MITPIFTSKKLEKLAKKIIEASEKEGEEMSVLGKWNANVFYISRKKCWLVTNSRTRYSIILSDITSADFPQLTKLFKDTLFTQMIYDGIFIDPDEIDSLIGTLKFFPTDNDRRTIGFQNSLFSTLDYRKEEYGALGNWPVKQITHYLNETLFHWGKPTMTNYTYPVTELKKLLGK